MNLKVMESRSQRANMNQEGGRFNKPCLLLKQTVGKNSYNLPLVGQQTRYRCGQRCFLFVLSMQSGLIYWAYKLFKVSFSLLLNTVRFSYGLGRTDEFRKWKQHQLIKAFRILSPKFMKKLRLLRDATCH